MNNYLRFLYDLFEDYRFSKINPKILTFGYVNRKAIVLGSLKKRNRSAQLLHPYNLSKINFMKNSLTFKFIQTFIVFFICSMIWNQSQAQSKITLTNNTLTNDSPVATGLLLYKLSDLQEPSDLNLIPQAYGFDNEHEFSSRWPLILENSREELENLFKLCQVDCANRFKALLSQNNINDLTITRVIEIFESHQFLNARCKELWNVLSQIREKSNTNGLMSEISKKLTSEDVQLAEKILKMTKDEFLQMAFGDSRGTTSIVKKIDKLNQSL